jgi:hypothetical protein
MQATEVFGTLSASLEIVIVTHFCRDDRSRRNDVPQILSCFLLPCFVILSSLFSFQSTPRYLIIDNCAALVSAVLNYLRFQPALVDR